MGREKINTGISAQEVEAGVLTLHEVSVKMSGRSLASLSTQRRNQILEPFAKMVREGQLRASESSSASMKKIMTTLRMENGLDLLSETAETQIYNSFWGNLGNALAVAKADKRYEEAWRRLITSLEVSTTDIRRQLGRNIVIAQGYGWHTTIFPELLFNQLTVTSIWQRFSRVTGDYEQYGMLSMGASRRRTLSDLFFGRDYREPHLTKEISQDANLHIENFEGTMATDLMTLKGVALNGSLLSDNGSITAAAVNKVKKLTQISDFSVTPGLWPLDRVEMLCLTYFTLHGIIGKNAKQRIDIKSLAEFAADQMPGLLVGPMLNTFIPALQGFTKTWTASSYAPRLVTAVTLIAIEAKDEWMSLDNFRMQLLCSNVEGESNYLYLNLFPEREREKAKLARRSDKGLGIIGTPIEWFEEVGLKFAIHWLRYLCALGMAEIAIDPEAKEDDPMEGMRYIRLTGLGRFIFRIDANYVPKVAKGSQEVEFDAQNGIITVDEKSPFQMFLGSVAKRISQTRFRISEETLIAGCKRKSELEQRIMNLRTIVDPEKEPAMKKIIEEAMGHTDCAERDGGYTLIRLRPDLPGLREAILTNFELRKMTILAGPTLALVKTQKLDRFNAICAAYGYLME